MAKRHYSSMISEDKSAPCLLPRNVIEKNYEQGSTYHMTYVDTLYTGSQIQLHEDSADFKKSMGPKKY